MNDERIRWALKEMPAARPGPDFEERVLARLAAARRAGIDTGRGHRFFAPARLAAAAAVVVAFAGAGWWAADRGREHARQAELEALRLESARLQAEVAAVKRQLAEPAPVVYLGGTERVDLVLDVGSLHRAGLPPRAAEAGPRPARPVVTPARSQ